MARTRRSAAPARGGPSAQRAWRAAARALSRGRPCPDARRPRRAGGHGAHPPLPRHAAAPAPTLISPTAPARRAAVHAGGGRGPELRCATGGNREHEEQPCEEGRVRRGAARRSGRPAAAAAHSVPRLQGGFLVWRLKKKGKSVFFHLRLPPLPSIPSKRAHKSKNKTRGHTCTTKLFRSIRVRTNFHKS